MVRKENSELETKYHALHQQSYKGAPLLLVKERIEKAFDFKLKPVLVSSRKGLLSLPREDVEVVYFIISVDPCDIFAPTRVLYCGSTNNLKNRIIGHLNSTVKEVEDLGWPIWISWIVSKSRNRDERKAQRILRTPLD